MGFNMIHNFEIKRGCIVYKDGTKVVLFDTGCAQTISVEQDVRGEIFPKVNKFVDPTVKQILGMDVITQRVFIDYPKKELVYGDVTTIDTPIAKYDLDIVAYGLLTVSLNIGDQKRKMLLDTGAATSYLLEKYAIQGDPAGQIEDFYVGEPNLFTTKLYSLSTECGKSMPIPIKYGLPTDSIEQTINMLRVDGIIGYEWLCPFKILLDVPNRCLTLGK